MGLRKLTLLAFGGSQILGASAVAIEKRQDVTHKFCPGGTNICFSETQVSDITFRIAIPDVQSAPFDILLQIVAPISTVGWAGVAWGGKMANNPLTVGWASGSSVVVSSRWATGHTLPQAYTGARYQILPSAHTNSTHWHLDVLCTGCSQFGTTSLNPNGANTLAWAKSSKAVQTPSSNSSTFGYHDGRGTFSHDFSSAKIPQGVFDALVYDLSDQNGVSPASTSKAQSQTGAPTTVVAPPVVSTSVVALPPVSKSSTVAEPPSVVTTLSNPPRPTTTSTKPIVQTSVVTLPHTTPPGVDTPITVTTPRQPAQPPTPTTSVVTIWITQPASGPPVTFTQPGGGPIGVTITVPAPSSTVAPLGPWGAGPPPWASSGATPPWGTVGPPPWATVVTPPVIPFGKGKGKGKFRPPGTPIAVAPEES